MNQVTSRKEISCTPSTGNGCGTGNASEGSSVIENLLNRLESARQTGPDKWLARCPAHEDRSPSLSIAVNSDGTILIHCFAGCGAIDIVESIGLRLSVLFPKPLDHHIKGKRYQPPYRQILRTVAHDARVVSLFINRTDDDLSDDDLRVVNTALANLQRMGDR